jgi:hypothetical protein
VVQIVDCDREPHELGDPVSQQGNLRIERAHTQGHDRQSDADGPEQASHDEHREDCTQQRFPLKEPLGLSG